MNEIEKELGDCRERMLVAEDALIKRGFSEEHWDLIKEYVSAAVMHGLLQVGKALNPKISL